MVFRSLLIALLILSCAGNQAVHLQAAPLCIFEENAAAAAWQEIISLSQALKLVLSNSPELTVSELEIQAASAHRLQAGLKPNPELTATAENFAAHGGNGLFRYTESTLQISQRLERGGKRALRVQSAEKEIGLAATMRELRKADLSMATALAIAEVLAGQERLINQQEQSRLWQQSYDAVAERVSAGKVSPVEQTRATTALATAHLEEKKQERALLAAKDRLAALWGGTGQEFEKAQGQFEIPLLPAIDNAECIKSTPDLQMAAAELESRRALLALEEASRKPDVTVSVGFRRLNIEHQETWVAGISLPLPFFDKRQGTIAEARIRVEKSLAEQKSLEWQMRSRLAQARHEHAIAQAEAAVLIQTALPAAKEAMSAVEEGYRYGKFDYLSVLDAQRTYAELQRRHIEAVASGMKAAVEIGRLTVCNTLFNHSHPGSQTKESNHAK